MVVPISPYTYIADASASQIEIRFDVDVVPGQTLHRIQAVHVSNDGRDFSRDDFDRLARIADGNPNAEAVGQFGVGFYSVFALTEEPCVISGGRCLRFEWEGERLVTFA